MTWLRRHPVTDEDLSAYVDGALAPGRLAAVETHLHGCARCRGVVAEMGSVKALLAALPPATASRSFALTPAAAGERRTAPVGRASPRLLLAPALALSLLVVLLAIDFTAIPSTNGGAAPTGITAGSKSLAQPEGGARTGAPALTPVASLARDAAAGQSLAPRPADNGPAAAQPPPATAAAAQGESARPGAATVSTPPPETPGVAALAAPRRDHSTERAALRVLEGVAGAGLVASLAYLIWKRRAISG